MILAVGFRVRNKRGVQCRIWASTVLKEYMIKGFVMDDERLKNPDGRPDYFDKLLDRILEFNDNKVLVGHGSVSKSQMEKIAHNVYAQFDAKRKAYDARQADAQDLQELEQDIKT